MFKYGFLVFKGVARISTSDKDMTLSKIFYLFMTFTLLESQFLFNTLDLRLLYLNIVKFN